MQQQFRPRRLLGVISIVIGLTLFAIYFVQINRSDSVNAPIPSARTTPIAAANPMIEPSNTIEVKPTAGIEILATATQAGSTPLIPIQTLITPTPRPTTIRGPTALPPIAGTGLYSTRERFGLGVSYLERKKGRLSELGPGFYLTWGMSTIEQSVETVTFLPMVRIQKGQPRLALSIYTQYALAHPGRVWLIGNEPDVPWQDNSTPQEYAAAYHLYYTAIKNADPTSRIAIAGISQPTPLRLKYLDQTLAAYQSQFGTPMPIDVWNIHNFILNEQRGSWGVDIPPGTSTDRGQLISIDQNDDLNIFRQQIIDFRAWMAVHGYRDKELIVSEYGILMPPDYGYDYVRVRDFMLHSFDFFLTATDNSTGLPADGNRLVQRWCWFSLSDQEYPTGNLIDFKTGDIAPLGYDFINYLQLN